MGMIHSTGQGSLRGVEQYSGRSQRHTSLEHNRPCPFKVQVAGDIPDFDPGDFVDPKDHKRLDRFTLFAMYAGGKAIEDSGIDFSKEDPFRTGVILGSGIGGIVGDRSPSRTLAQQRPRSRQPADHPKLMLNAAGGNLSIRYGLRGPNYTVATACASATNAMGDAMKTIQYDDADIVVTGGTEAAITAMGLSAFQNMKALSDRNDAPHLASRPFDAGRDGFVLSEGAGILIFEELEHARARGARIYAEVLGYGASGDAGHITQPDPEGSGCRAGYAKRTARCKAGCEYRRLYQRARHQHSAG